MFKPLCILIVDDQPRARQSLRALLATQFQLTQICEAENGSEAILCVEECCPDIVLMDARMSEMDGIEATRILKEKVPGIRVIVISLYDEYRALALAAGADAFVSKGEPPEELLELVAQIAKEDNHDAT